MNCTELILSLRSITISNIYVYKYKNLDVSRCACGSQGLYIIFLVFLHYVYLALVHFYDWTLSHACALLATCADPSAPLCSARTFTCSPGIPPRCNQTTLPAGLPSSFTSLFACVNRYIWSDSLAPVSVF